MSYLYEISSTIEFFPVAFVPKICYAKDNATERDEEWGIGAEVPYHSPLFCVHGAERSMAAKAAPPRHGEWGKGFPCLLILGKVFRVRGAQIT